jgi:hypothetical protein
MRQFLTVCVILSLAAAAMAAAQPSRAQEEAGIEPSGQRAASLGKKAVLTSKMGPVLLIPESTGDVVGMYSPADGTYLGDLIVDDTSGTSYNLQTPKHAVQGPDNNIYVADQISDAVYIFDTTGAYLSTYCSGYNNLRGIDFRGDHLFITSGDGYVAEFSGPNTFFRNFISDGSDPFDIHFLPDGRALLSDIAGTTDNVRLYDTNGVFIAQIFSASFPQQIQGDPVLPGTFLNAAFSSNVITDFGLDSVITAQLTYGGGRGVYRLGNGNLLATSSNGIQELDSTTGAVVQTERTGSGQYIELCNVATGVSGGPSTPLGDRLLSLAPNFPNPVRGRTNISFNLPKAGAYELRVFNIAGQMVDRMTGTGQAGPNRLTWNAGRLAAGVYLYSVSSNGQSATRKLVVVK